MLNKRIGEVAQAEQALRASEMRYRRLFESARDGILILEAESGRVIDVNPYLAELLGYARGDFIDKHIWDFGPFKDIIASKSAFDELRARDYVAYEDLPLQTVDGRRVDVGFVSNVYQEDGKRIIQCNIRDITSRKLDEKIRAGLEEQLRASQRMEAIGSLAGGIAHDFNNLLSVILGYTELVLQGLPEGKARSDLLEVEKASERGAALTRQLLAFGRAQHLQPAPLDLNQVIEGLQPMLRRIVSEDVEIVYTMGARLGLAMADRSQLEQVIVNLVANAHDAMPTGGKLVIETANVELDADTVALHVAVEPGPYVMLAVTDTGYGMDAETRARIFEPFFSTKEPGRGTGLGLSTVYGIVKQSGGHIWVYSEPGHGTSFRVYLPRELSVLVPASHTPPIRTSGPKTGTETVLVVEDEEAVRNLIERVLADAGYTVLTATNGDDALLLCESHAGDIPLVLTDVVMPRKSGPMFATQLRLIRPTTKVLFMSGYAKESIPQGGLRATRTWFLGKPFGVADLTDKVREILDDVPTP